MERLLYFLSTTVNIVVFQNVLPIVFSVVTVLLIYYCLVVLLLDAILNFEGTNKTLTTAGIFATYPKDFLTIGGAFGDQVVPVLGR